MTPAPAPHPVGPADPVSSGGPAGPADPVRPVHLPRPVPPTATYRLQLQPDFPFAAAERAVPYLASLSVSHLHLSPVLEAVPGSPHGYDVIDHGAVRAELGGAAGLRSLARTAQAHGLGLIADIVPNHMAVPAPEHLNGPLWAVLRDGPASPYARWFDIDWSQHDGKVLLPMLSGPLGAERERFTVDGSVLRYGDHALPLRPGTEHLALPGLLAAQWYRPAWWRLARTELNYRRFFTISDLIAVRVEDPEVFAATHATVLALLRDGVLDGLRVDHPDGLADPGGYLRRLDEAVRDATARERGPGAHCGEPGTHEGEAGAHRAAGAPGGPAAPGRGRLPRAGGRWTVVEKILGVDERLPADWPVAGTTGYDALRHVDGLFLDPAGAAALADAYRATVAPADDRGGDWAATARRAAYHVVTYELAAEVERLTRTASLLCAASPQWSDHAPWALRTAIRELLVRLPVYRPYATPDAPARAVDAELLATAAHAARSCFAVAREADAVDVVRDAALGRIGAGPRHRDFCARFAQTASAVRAKSLEDAAFYRYVPLLSATEVGGAPQRAAVSPAQFHAFCARLQRDWPDTGTVLTTHDTKRSADVRARIAALTECPSSWDDVVRRLTARAEPPAPDAHVAWVAWQTALGCPGIGPERLVPAVLKAVREAGLHTTWADPDEAYEAAVAAFTQAGPAGPPPAELRAFQQGLDASARANTLGATLLHLTMPGVPDVYMDTEGTYVALVDPDNRRPPRFHGELAAQLAGRGGQDGLALAACGAAAGAGPKAGDAAPKGDAAPNDLCATKLLLTATALRLRARHPEWFGTAASYEPLAAHGPAAAHCVAFARSGQVVSAATRLPRALAASGGWRGTLLAVPGAGRWRDLLTGTALTADTVRTDPDEPARLKGLALDELFARYPVALLVRD
ncbi:malto-oligosyltrehalose synthase [Streptomyces zagrosensis]|uniref:(1->4)-alpha-D-glucan 1-alpha-D-glucosylmutase n=1 Tax=Streptomyces zagrosensis TaxID=1042984 RepID=A0A7W9UYV7_9ACTN|nr:malto-oligosyltrehalose synthase [Streptomyces zagrosensis]MBB5936092.1 (1->4)-alpha-D-glucan 1-alpha-D-glucosylmutase [Streptomyces zagrosensis]